MVDRIPLFPDDGTYPGYTATQPEVLTQDQYRTGPVNYFTQVLGPQTASLKEETGVGVTKAPEVRLEETREDDPSSKVPSAILAATRPTLGGDISASGEISFDIPATNPGRFENYSDYLKSSANHDRISLVDNIYEGVFDPNKEVQLGKGFSGAIKEGQERVSGFSDKLKDKDVQARAGMVGLAATQGTMSGGLAATMLGGSTVTNAFGKNSYRPIGALGAIADMVHARQYVDMNYIRAARRANPYGDTGFAMSLGNYGITRRPGESTYTGNTRGMDIETIVALEAISKGYDPTQGRYNMRDPSKSQTVTRSGGIQVSDNPMDGFIRANGTVYDPRFIGAGPSGTYARKDMVMKAANTHLGYISNPEDRYDAMSNAMAMARTGDMTIAQALARIPSPTLQGPAYRAGAVEQQVTRDDSGDSSERGTSYSVTRDDPTYSSSAVDDQVTGGGVSGYASEGRITDRAPADGYSGSSGGFTGARAMGGPIGLAMGGAPGMASGFVERPPDQVPEDQTVADDKKAQLPEGAFVINAAAAEFMGTDDVRTMLLDAHKEALRQGLVVDKQGNGAKLIDVAISRGEVVVAPHLAKIIGYDRLTKINNRGKPETRERIQENGQAAAPATVQAVFGQKIMGRTFGMDPVSPEVTAPQEGFVAPQRQPAPPTPESYANEMPPRQGFVEKEAEFPDIPDEVPQEFMDKLTDLYSEPVTRTRLLNFYKTLSDVELLTYLTMSETKAATAEPQHMYAVAQTTVNRKDNTDPNLGFRKQDTLPKVILKRLSKGAFEYDGLDKTRGVGMQNEFNSNFNNFKRGVSRAYAISSDVLSGEMESSPAIPKDVMWYENPTTTGTSWMQDNLQYFDTFGSHAFYTAPPK